MDSRVIFVNVTKQCNVNCPRCYLTEENRANKNRLPVSHLEKLLSSQYVQNADDIVVVLQGGEPSILGYAGLLDYTTIIKKTVPNAKIAMVSNLLNMPDWLVEFSISALDGRLETTYATGHKFTLDGSEDKYNHRFKQSLKKAVESGLSCPVNVELNIETYEKGPQVLVDVAKYTGAKVWEFDFSVDFNQFHKSQSYSLFGYPVVVSTATYDQFYSYVFEFGRLFKEQIGDGLSCGVIDQFRNKSNSINFNIQREKDFITINPDGTVTTNPLFSDIVPTYLGNIGTKNLDDIICSPLRIRRMLHEKNRVEKCYKCPYYDNCGGGVSHLPIYDHGKNCVGGIENWASSNE